MVCFRCTGAALQRHEAHLRRERTSTLQAMQIHETVSPARWAQNVDKTAGKYGIYVGLIMIYPVKNGIYGIYVDLSS
jgi:hypothetical protein